MRLETPLSKQKSSERSRTPDALFFLDGPGFCMKRDSVLRSSDGSGLRLLTARLYNPVAADLEYTRQLGMLICAIRTPARL